MLLAFLRPAGIHPHLIVGKGDWKQVKGSGGGWGQYLTMFIKSRCMARTNEFIISVFKLDGASQMCAFG
jgi:hypothetical protein